MSKLQENRRSFYFTKQIEKNPVEVSCAFGWICIDENLGRDGLFGKEKHLRMTMTTEDARQLIEALKKFVPESETKAMRELVQDLEKGGY